MMEPLDPNLDFEEESTLDLHLILALVRQWFWVFILAAVLAGAAAFIVSKQMTPIFEATTTILINEAPSNKSTDYTSVMTSERLAQTYAAMLTKRPSLEGVIAQLSLTTNAEDLAKTITVAPVRDTQLINISVQNPDPYLASTIANTLVSVFSTQIQSTQSERYAASKQSLQKQMSDTEYQITLLRAQYDQERDPANAARIEDKIARYESTYNNLALSYEQVRLTEAQTVSSIVQVEEAAMPSIPVSPKTLQNTLLAAVVGAMLAAGVVFLIETLQDVIKDPDEITRRFKLPILSMIGTYDTNGDGPITQTQPRSFEAEAFRILRTNVQYAAVDKPIRTLLITSPTPADGKTTVAANLAVVSAQGSKRVTLIDTDLHRPRAHALFNTSNRYGLSTLFAQTDIAPASLLQETKTLDLKFLGSGPIVPNPSELLGSRKMQDLVTSLGNEADLIIIDSPPVLSVTDAVVLAPHVDAVLIVIKPEQTNLRALKQTIEQLRRVGANVIGVVLNGIESRRSHYNYYYPGYYANRAHYDSYSTAAAAGNKSNRSAKEKRKTWPLGKK